MKKFKILSKSTLVDSPYCPIEKHIVEFHDGNQGEWFVNTSRDAVIVIPFLETGEVILQKSYKHGGGEVVTEFCAGLIDEGETPEQSAKRELREETGYGGETFSKIGEVLANPTGSTMRYHFFVAKKCTKVGERKLDLSEQIEVFLVENLEEAKKLLTDKNTKTSSATMAGLAFV
ncbi:NUDIX hydrolase [Candidatus Gracilibacteria bacterium]|nr:NUDIX hydrolase [Candidatus Gracilibacteria bacterium]